ncbi:MAG: AtpZ/AtpI family protein, partial [Planctomycetes bacterium]|nr:AtpZ/AtpI family protein [Planctomycetota bacterium]
TYDSLADASHYALLGIEETATAEQVNEAYFKQAKRWHTDRFAGMGLEFGSGIAGFVLLGWWIDRSFNTEPVALVTGAVLGSVGGLYVLIRRAFEMQKEASPPRRSGDERKDDSGEPGPN